MPNAERCRLVGTPPIGRLGRPGAIRGGFTPEARGDAQSLRAALVEIYTTMCAYCERNARAEIIVTQFGKWAESHV